MFYLFKRRKYFKAKSIEMKLLSLQIENFIAQFIEAVTFILIKQF